MNTPSLVQVLVFLVLLVACVPLLGGYMARVFTAERTVLTPWLAPLERGIYRLAGCNPQEEMTWTAYLWALVAFHVVGFLAVLGLQLAQGALGLNPQHWPGVPFALALNTAVSFLTNTNWQAYAGESTLSTLTQMLGLTVHNFVSAASGIAVLLAVIRGLVRRSGTTVGNAWADLVRSTLYVLLPLSLVLAVLLISQGVVQTGAPYAEATTLEGAMQLLPLGPAASQIAIKQLGTNGGGFYGVNSAHPYENPTAFSNLLELLALLVIPAALCYTYGVMVGARRQGWVIFGAMLALYLAGLALALTAEGQFAGAMEGKEVRFGVANSVLFAHATTATSCGAVNAMHDSMAPLTGLVLMFNLMLGEVVFGGVGCGLYGMLLFVVLTVFMAGLMVGRTPEYLGKKIEQREVLLAMVAVLVPSAALLVPAAIAAVTPAGLDSLNNGGPHGLSEILYAFASMAGNNGSAFAGLNANTPFYNYVGALVMLVGRCVVMLPALALAGGLVSKKVAPPSAGTFPTDGVLFGVLLVAVVLIVGLLTHIPALTLGPLVEHLLLQQGRFF